MPFNELEQARIQPLLAEWIESRRPPAHLRAEVDLAFRVSGQSVELLEVRAAWQGRSGEKTERPLAKATFVRSKSHWRIFWRGADLKWRRYEPFPLAESVEQFLAVVGEDEHACFFG